VLTEAGFPGLTTGITKAFFHIAGMFALPTDRLKRAVRYLRAVMPRCFRCLGVKPSGPVAVDLLEALMASKTCTEEKGA
jgi:hypothetical protein